MKNSDIRWKQRFQNYEKAFALLSDALKDGSDKLSLLEKEGALQRFEFTFELAWKVMKDYLEESGVVINTVTPKNVIKQAFAAKIIENGQVWIDMLMSRNLMSHTYDFVKFEAIAKDVEKKYLVELKKLEQFFKKTV
ncbi:MAG: nucleotidyltransferase [Pelagibacterales bacterium]|nr:nucleotidyltransferase [Pelagibacterales bacterium]